MAKSEFLYLTIVWPFSTTNSNESKDSNANRISFRAASDEASTIQYLFWLNKHMKPYINNNIAELQRIDDLDVLAIPKGK